MFLIEKSPKTLYNSSQKRPISNLSEISYSSLVRFSIKSNIQFRNTNKIFQKMVPKLSCISC